MFVKCPISYPGSPRGADHLFRILTLVFIAISTLSSGLAQQEQVFISPLGSTVRLDLNTSTDEAYVLESQAELMEGEEWEPLMQFRGNTSKPVQFVDPICGTSSQRYFRLRKLLAQGPREVSNFRLLDLQGEAHELYYNWPAKGIVLVLGGMDFDGIAASNELLLPLQEQYGEDALLIWHIVLAGAANRDVLQARYPNQSASMPILLDVHQGVTRGLGSHEAPEAILVDPRQWSMVYRGPLEIRTSLGEEEHVISPLADAVHAFMEGKEPVVSHLKPFGAANGMEDIQTPSYASEIAPLLIQNCVPCHSEGNIAPWSMDSHAVIKEFSGLIKSAVLAGEMPPWHAEPQYRDFSNDKALSVEEVNQLVAWIDAGAPRGDGPDPLPEASQVVPEDWPMGPPDHIVSIPLQRIPAQGSVDYRYFVVQSPFPRNVWLKAVDVRPGDRSVVHHCLVFKGNVLELLALRGGLGGFFAGYVPGMEQVPFPDGTGKRLRKSDILLFQMHYTTNGKAASDRTQLGFYLADEKPARELVTGSAFDVDFTIPPNERGVYVRATTTMPVASTLFEFSPHMHYRGAKSRYTLVFPDRTQEVVLHVPAYFFDWQALYRLAEPIDVPAGTRVICEGWFDNTIQNRFNPNPDDTVTFGEQSWEEMFIGYINYAEQ